MTHDTDLKGISRRELLNAAAVSLAAVACPRSLFAADARKTRAAEASRRFPHFRSTPVFYFNVKMQDGFWASRQRTVRDVTVAWATRHWDAAGGLEAYRSNPTGYQARTQPGDMEAIKFIESMAAVVGLQRDAAIEGLIDAWAKVLIERQGPDGYLQAGFGTTVSHPPRRWQAFPASHESYLIGHYLEAALAYRESTGSTALYDSAIRAIDNMAASLLDSDRPYISGHPEIEQALMRLYGETGDSKYVRLCEWLLVQRGHFEGRTSGGKEWLDELPVKDWRTIEGHAVCAAYLFNGATEYIGATGDTSNQEAVLSAWRDLVQHKMYLHGASGNISSKFEGYLSQPYVIPPQDTYGETCAAYANFQWAHSLFRLTGDAAHLDVAERILYNVFPASLSLEGNRYFYCNVSQTDDSVLRHDWHRTPCCPPNIVKLICKVGGYLYSTDRDGIFVQHYAASQADIPYGAGVRLIQEANYPWDGAISLHVQPKAAATFTLRLRIPAWTENAVATVNGHAVDGETHNGWLAIRRRWRPGDRVELNLPMKIQRVRLPLEFKDYQGLVALQRGPIVYCVEQVDSPAPVGWLYLPQEVEILAERRADLLGGVTVLKANLPQSNLMYDATPSIVPVTFVPYAVWNNRAPGPMRIWLLTDKIPLEKYLI